jgi:hypothetical protein
MKKIILAIVCLFIFTSSSYSQTDLGTMLQKVGGEYAQKYLEPFTTGLGTNLNSGFIGGYNASDYHRIPIWPHFYAGVKFCGVVMQDVDKMFNLNFQSNITYGGTTVPVNWTVNNAPTVFGSTTPAVAHGTFTYSGIQRDTTISLIGGVEDVKFIPIFIPQIGVGTILGTDVVFRTLPGVNYGNYGSFKLFGVALRHNIGAYAKMPFDIAVQGGYQSFGIKDKNNNKFIDANSLFVNLQFSKTLAIVNIYAAAQYENYSVDVNYYYGNTNIGFNQKGDNSFRGILGATLSLALIKVNVDLNYGSKFAFTAGLGVGL